MEVAIAEKELTTHGLSPKDVFKFTDQFVTKALEDLDEGSPEEYLIKQVVAEITKPGIGEFETAKIAMKDRLYNDDEDHYPIPKEHPGIHLRQRRPDGKYLNIYIYGGLNDPDADALRDNMTSHRKGEDSVSQTESLLSQSTNIRLAITNENGNNLSSHLWLETSLGSKDPSKLISAEIGNNAFADEILLPYTITEPIIKETLLVTKIKQTLNQRPR